MELYTKEDIIRGKHSPAFSSLSEAKLMNDLTEGLLKEYAQNDPLLRQAKLSNQFGTICLKSGKYEKGISLFEKAINNFNMYISECEDKQLRKDLRFTNAYYNLGSTFAATHHYERAIEYYLLVLEHSPFNRVEDEEINTVEVESETHFNSFGAFIEGLNSLAVMLSTKGEVTLALLACQRSLQFNQASVEGIINMGNILRQLDKREIAIHFAWERLKLITTNYIQPSIIFCYPPHELPQTTTHIKPQIGQIGEIEESKEFILNIVCVKYGMKYPAHYVNKLYYGVKRFLTIPYNFICFTEDPQGLNKNIQICKLSGQLEGWWTKANIFNTKGII